MHDAALVVLFILIVVIVLMVNKCSSRSTFTFNNSEHQRSSRSGATFNNSEYQYSNPDLTKEQFYYDCISKECGGNTHDYYCLQKCHLKTFRRGMKTMDTKDWVCMPYANDEDAYYRCLANTYADYRYP